jgi:prepilin-type N-terminal cleavage/methylation domain-containing protein
MSRKNFKGFTLVELAVVIVIIGVLAAFGVPQFLKSVERSKAAEAFNYLAAVRGAQERYVAMQGIYADEANKSKLDIAQGPPKYFDVGVISIATTAGSPTWDLTLNRKASSSSYGTYSIMFTQDGFNTDSAASTIMVYTDICPIGN